MLFRQATLLLAASAALLACGGSNTDSPVRRPGAAETASTMALEAGAAALQSKPPIDANNAYLNGFHFYSGHMSAQMEAHHYCTILNDDVIQCVSRTAGGDAGAGGTGCEEGQDGTGRAGCA